MRVTHDIQIQFEENWDEANWMRLVKVEIAEKYPELSDIHQKILSVVLTSGYTPVSNVIGSVSSMLDPITPSSKFSMVLDEVVKLAEMDYIDLDIKSITYVHSKIKLSTKKIKRNFIPPLLIPPLPIRNNKTSGYHKLKRDSVILGGAINHHSFDACLDVLNTQNNVSYKINTYVTKELSPPEPKSEDYESYVIFRQVKQNFEEFSKQTEEILEHMSVSPCFYLTNKVDKRGRMYVHGYHITTQGDDYRKAMIDFYHGEHISGDL